MSTGIIPTLRTGRAHPHPEPISEAMYSAVELMPGDRAVVLLDQRKLPAVEKYEILNRPEQVVEAITDMTIRGAPAIGIAAAYAMVLASTAAEKMPAHEQVAALDAADVALRATRPTAVNLTWALSRMIRIMRENAGISGQERTAKLAAEARAIHREDVLACKKIGQLGAAFVPDSATVLTHCNAGALATGGYGTALGIVRGARAAGKKISVIAAETRPLLQGARLTAWELERDGFPVTVVTDSSVASILASGKIDLVVVGADRIAANGDVANKIGTYSVACLAHAHGVPFYVAAPWSTVDLKTKTGASIPIEQRAEREITHVESTQLVPDGVHVQNAAFDVTPARLIRAIITERGVAEAPSEATLARLA